MTAGEFDVGFWGGFLGRPSKQNIKGCRTILNLTGFHRNVKSDLQIRLIGDLLGREMWADRKTLSGAFRESCMGVRNTFEIFKNNSKS